MADRPKIFLIGLNKTATRSVFVLFRRSGYKAEHYAHGALGRDIVEAREAGTKPLADYADTDVFTDMEDVNGPDRAYEGYAEFAYLDQHYPDAKFILNTRPLNGWLRSRMLHREGSYFRKWVALYGTDDPIEVMTRWKKQYEDHHKAVRDYFADKPGRLLEFQIGKDDIQNIVEFVDPHYTLDLSKWGNETLRVKQNQARKRKQLKALQKSIAEEKSARKAARRAERAAMAEGLPEDTKKAANG